MFIPRGVRRSQVVEIGRDDDGVSKICEWRTSHVHQINVIDWVRHSVLLVRCDA